ncbi:MAG: ATPase [Thiotrichales bacterium]|nr:ATPase [Thiotrichales bacterium]|tara:strand:- start:613 stop:1467 length:855 start_codon:yes stop_codon:yes gene_type:complete
MRMTREEFMAWDNKAVTLMGMSGVGKTTMANKLPASNWFHYSGDYRIGTKYMQEPIMDSIKREAMQVPVLRQLLRNDSIYIASNITIHNLTPISSFLGKVGDPERGGLPLDEFKRRQRLHHAAEVAAMRDVVQFIEKAREIYDYEHFINDAGGSLCELDDPETMELLAQHTVLVYIESDEKIEQAVIDRQRTSPKPLYYQEEFLDRMLDEFMSQEGINRIEKIDPDYFVRWTFPKLVSHRRPLYTAIAAEHGYVVSAQATEKVSDERSFVELVGTSLAEREAAA